MIEGISASKVPEKIRPLYEAPGEFQVLEEAQKLIKNSSTEEQQYLLRDLFFLAIVNDALRGMDEHRQEALLNLVNDFAVANRQDASSRFLRLLEDTLR